MNNGAPPLPQNNELRFQQSFSSVVNEPSRRKGISDIIKDIIDIQEEETPAVEATSELHGALVPQLVDFVPYLDSFALAWDAYERSHSSGPHVETEDGQASYARSVVPPEYFEEDFQLGDSSYWEDLRRTVLLQEEHNDELSGYLDAVELSLSGSIQVAQRDHFFERMVHSHKPLVEDIAAALSVVTAARGRLQSAQVAQQECGLAVARLARRKARVAQVLRRLEGFALIEGMAEQVSGLVDSKDYCAALRLLENQSEALERELEDFAVAQVWCLRLSQLGRTLAFCVQSDFVQQATEAVLGADVEADPASPPESQESLRTLCWCLSRRKELRSVLNSALHDNLMLKLKDRLRSEVQQILEDMCLATAPQEALEEELVESVAEPAAEAAAEPAAEPAVIAPSPGHGLEQESPARKSKKKGPRKLLQKVTGKLRSSPSKSAKAGAVEPGPSPFKMPEEVEVATPCNSESPKAATKAVLHIASSVGELSVERFIAFWQRVLEFLVDIAGRFFVFAESVAQSSSEGGADVSADLLQLGDGFLEALLQKAGAFLQARQAAHQSLSIPDWRQLMAHTTEALDQITTLQRQWSERLGRESSVGVGVGLRSILGAQALPVFQTFHQKCLAEVQASLESEHWERTDVPQQYSQLIREIVDTGVEQQPAEGQAEEAGRCLHLRGVKFLVVPAVLKLIHLLVEYVRLCRDWGACGPQIVWCMAQLLRHFNQQVHRAVLGGQAVHSQMLKKINATHLALCCQCCSVVEALVPGVQELLLRIIQEGRASEGEALLEPVGDLSKVVGEYAAHRAEIFEKLTAILCERYEYHSKRWLGCAHPEVPSPAVDSSHPVEQGAEVADVQHAPHSALEGLVKDIAAMYSVLSKSLSMESVQKIFGKAFAEMASKFEQRLGSGLPAKSPPYEGMAGRSLGDRLVMDIAFLHEQLRRLSGIAVPSQNLLSDFVYHVQAKLPREDPLQHLHASTLEALQRTGKIAL